ncbi:unnamed protein product, partial [Effrenium voratum]
ASFPMRLHAMLWNCLPLLCLVQPALGGPTVLEPDFELVSFTPEDGNTLSGRQALTVVYSLAVLPLGADLGDGPLPEEYVPFILEGSEVPGRLHWVSSSIARFDPSVDWPTDLKELIVTFNSALKSVSGKTLTKAPKRHSFSTHPLDYWVRRVHSKMLAELTGNTWSSDLEEQKFIPKGAHECPSDARVLVTFNGPVVLQRFIKDPSMFELRTGLLQQFAVKSVAPCEGEAATPLRLELGEPAAVNESRCLEVTLPELETGEEYVLGLRPGARYHPFAGPFRGKSKIRLTGLRPFRFNFLKRRYGKEFFKIYLRHGLQGANRSLDHLQHAFSVTSIADGQVLEHQLSLPHKATLKLKVHDLEPEQQYLIRVSPTSPVFDGTGLPLEASEVRLTMSTLPGVFLAPQPPNPSLWAASCADRFLPSDLPATFPILQRRPPPMMLGRNVDPDAALQAFVCPITSTEELGDFLSFFFSPAKADDSIPGPCARRSAKAYPGVVLGSSKREVRYSEVPLSFQASRLLFMEYTCVGEKVGVHCPVERPSNRARFLNAASFHALTAFAGPRGAPSEALHSSVVVSVHGIADHEPIAGHEVEVWEIPSARWERGRSVQPPAKRTASARTNSEGRAQVALEESAGQYDKGYVVVVRDPQTGEILLGDLRQAQSQFWESR